MKQLWKEYTEANQLEYHDDDDDGDDDYDNDHSDHGHNHDSHSTHGGSQDGSHRGSDDGGSRPKDEAAETGDRKLQENVSQHNGTAPEDFNDFGQSADKQLQMDPQSYKDWPEDEQEAYYIRCVLQKTFLAQHVPTIEVRAEIQCNF